MQSSSKFRVASRDLFVYQSVSGQEWLQLHEIDTSDVWAAVNVSLCHLPDTCSGALSDGTLWPHFAASNMAVPHVRSRFLGVGVASEMYEGGCCDSQPQAHGAG